MKATTTKAQSMRIQKDDVLKESKKGLLIYEHFAGRIPDKGKSMRSPFREDKNPSFQIFKTQSGHWAHKDFGADEYSGDALKFAALQWSINTRTDFTQLLEKIWTEVLEKQLPEENENNKMQYFYTESEVRESLNSPNILSRYLQRFAPPNKVRETLALYNVGSRDENTVLMWHKNFESKVPRVKVIKYREHEGSITKKQGGKSAVHSEPLSKHLGEKEYAPFPLFGEHLLREFPDWPVVIVEAEDSAIFLHLKLGGDVVYLASGGKLVSDRCKALKGRSCVVIPDRDVITNSKELEAARDTLKRAAVYGGKFELSRMMDELAHEVEPYLSHDKMSKLDPRDYFEARLMIEQGKPLPREVPTTSELVTN